ncbi:MAG: 1-(5-phosphoribosyl)-5-[(5-phosphoribosylamino)methylideneamino] imidazole-4-carboxamide isomerase [Armatimonadota bacterium]|nr:1-(5-phosphoribosyl)-5-[(5-phosphoribosylamino)methylideneamino] imidazole-4-carboxamide isomerase [Armatimonadota bacterium]
MDHGPFVLYPAIDLLAGRAVRLRQGDPSRQTPFDADPVAVAIQWEAEGARWLHVVDLDGALAGAPRHLGVIQRICGTVRIAVQVGGGLRTMADLRAVFDAGAARAILGTAALAGDLLPEAIAAYGARIAVALDGRGGAVAIEGWRRTSRRSVLEAAEQLAACGVPRFVYTDVEADGMLAGPDLDGLRRLIAATPVPVIAAGGIATIEHLRGVVAAGAEGAIIGRALYDGGLRLGAALAAVGGRG